MQPAARARQQVRVRRARLTRAAVRAPAPARGASATPPGRNNPLRPDAAPDGRVACRRYDVGMWSNVSSVLGRNILFWLLPVRWFNEGDGLAFELKSIICPCFTFVCPFP